MAWLGIAKVDFKSRHSESKVLAFDCHCTAFCLKICELGLCL